MAYTNGGNVKKGMFILYNGKPHAVTFHEFVSPGKGSAFTRTKLRNLETGNVFDFTFKTTEKVEVAEVESVELQYLYFDGNNYVFMNPRTFEQLEVSEAVVGDYAKFLKEEMIVYVQLFDGAAMGLFMPRKVVMTVTYTEDAVAGDRANAPKKPATIETGAEIMVPLFIKQGEQIIVDPETGTYVGRSSE